MTAMNTTRIPERYRIPREGGGTLEEFHYEYGGEKKRALVYLPEAAGSDPGRRFPTLTLFHGGGDSEDSFFGRLEGASPFKPMLDCMIAEGTVAPVIVAAPTYYHRDTEGAKKHAGDAMLLTETFHREVNEALFPALDVAYPTIPDRDCRAVGGFWMGAEATWSMLAWDGQNVRYYLPMSGDFWAVAVKGGLDFTSETCDRLIEGIRTSGLRPSDYEVFAATGTEDIAYPAMRPMVEELMTRAPWFTPAEDGGNLAWAVSPGWHGYEWCWDYLAMALPRFFPPEK